jgi:hypothetical protein
MNLVKAIGGIFGMRTLLIVERDRVTKMQGHLSYSSRL